MKQKILTFVYNQEQKKFLLFNIAKNPAIKKKWFTITGEINKGESPTMAVLRILKERTDLIATEVFNLNWGSVYKWKSEEIKEMNHLSFVNNRDITLNNKQSEYIWLTLKKFIKKIDWDDNKELLKKVLEKAVNKEIYFDKKERDQ